MKNDDNTTVSELKAQVMKFSNDRGWQPRHEPKNLAMSICIEAAELLEHFQWDDMTLNDKHKMGDELADILSYCLAFADAIDIDVTTAYTDKLARAALKYPLDTFNPDMHGGTADDYRAIKKAYRGKQPDSDT